MRKRIYIAGPMTKGDRVKHLATALTVYRTLMQLEFAPFCPQLTFLVDSLIRQPHESWLEADLPWVQAADAILRIPGESKGADMEVDCARRHDIPVFETIEQIINHFEGK